jgi:hypothetical protein
LVKTGLVATCTLYALAPRRPRRSSQRNISFSIGFLVNELRILNSVRDHRNVPCVLPTRALNAEAAERAFELRYSCSDALEVLTGEREEPHRRTRHDSRGPLSGQEDCNLAERVAGAESLRRLAGEDIGLSLFDEVDGGSIVVERDDIVARLNLDLAQRGRKLVELGCRKIG